MSTMTNKRSDRQRIVAVIGDGAIADDHPKDVLARDVGRGLADAGFGVFGAGDANEAVAIVVARMDAYRRRHRGSRRRRA